MPNNKFFTAKKKTKGPRTNFFFIFSSKSTLFWLRMLFIVFGAKNPQVFLKNVFICTFWDEPLHLVSDFTIFSIVVSKGTCFFFGGQYFSRYCLWYIDFTSLILVWPFFPVGSFSIPISMIHLGPIWLVLKKQKRKKTTRFIIMWNHFCSKYHFYYGEKRRVHKCC